MDGQSFLDLTIACEEGQAVVKEGGRFACKTVPVLPTCSANEVLTHDGTGYSCVHTDVPTCGSGQVLSFDGSGFVCVSTTDSIPTCESDQFLTYNGTSFQCAGTKHITPEIVSTDVSCSAYDWGGSWGCIATCPAGYTVTGGGFSASAAYTSGGHYSVRYGNGWFCNIGAIDHCTNGDGPPCGGYCTATCMKIAN